MLKPALLLLSVLVYLPALSQSEEYIRRKEEKLTRLSPFENIISNDPGRELIYQDDHVVAFEPLRKQAPVHLLIVPRKRIPTINDVTQEDATIMSQMFRAAKLLARKYGISETGYRLTINTNEDAGQSVFHIHMHLLGGMKLGPLVAQTYRDTRVKD